MAEKKEVILRTSLRPANQDLACFWKIVLYAIYTRTKLGHTKDL